MNIKRARKQFAKALRDDPAFRWAWQDVIAKLINEDQRKLEKADMRSYPSTFIFAGTVIDEIFK